MKMKEFGPPGGGARPWRPPLDPPMEIIFIAMVMIMSGVAYLFRHCWEFYSAELAVLAAVLLTNLVLVHMRLIDVGWPLVAAILIVILVIIIVGIQKTTETSEVHQNKIPLEPKDSSEDTETSVLKPHPPSRPEPPSSSMDPMPSIPSEKPMPPAVPGPSTEDTKKDISFEPNVSEPEIEEVVEPPPVKYPGIPVAHSPDDAERVLSENGHNRRELETEYEGQVGDLLESVPVMSNECY